MTPQQARGVHSTSSRIVLIAGAGSGKTYTLTRRIARLLADGVPASKILAVTFTNKATNEMRQRLRELVPDAEDLPEVRTLHSWATEVLRHHAAAFGRSPAFRLYDEDDAAEALRWAFFDAGDAKAFTRKSATLAKPGPGRSLFEARLREADAMSFDLVESELLRLLTTDATVQAKWTSRYAHVFVDEFQDTNLAQATILNGILPANFFCVGDPKQAIYGFRGADPSTMIAYARADSGFEVIELPHNFRSGAAIVDVANVAVRGDWAPMIPGRPELPATVHAWSVDHQPGWTVQIVRDLLTRHKPGEIMVLGRTWSSLDAVAARLREDGIAIDYLVDDQDPWKTPAGAWLRRLCLLAVNPSDNNVAQMVAEAGTDPKTRRYGRDGDPTISQLRADGEAARMRLVDVLKLRLPSLEHNVVKELETCATQALVTDRIPGEWVETIRTCLNELTRLRVATVDELLARVAYARPIERAATSDRVRLMTIHGAKGLEADAVAILDCVASAFPGNGDAEDQAEALRLYYVAETRARRELVHIVPRGVVDAFTKRLKLSPPSPWLAAAKVEIHPWPLRTWG